MGGRIRALRMHSESLKPLSDIGCQKKIQLRHLAQLNCQNELSARRARAARRQLTDAQKVMLGIEIEPDIAARAEKRMLAGR